MELIKRLMLSLILASAFALSIPPRSLAHAVQRPTSAQQTTKPPQGTPAAVKLEQLLTQSGYSFTKAADNVWVIKFRGKALPELNIIVTTTQALAIIGAVVVEKKNLKPSPELNYNLLKLNHKFDRVKIGIDDDEDLFVRVEVGARVLDLQEFKDNVEQVAAATDEVFAAIRPSVTTSE